MKCLVRKYVFTTTVEAEFHTVCDDAKEPFEVFATENNARESFESFTANDFTWELVSMKEESHEVIVKEKELTK